MPIRDHLPPKKPTYVSVSDIHHIFTAKNESGLIEGLTALRNQLTINGNDPPVQPNDARLILAKEWLEADPGAHEVFAVWEATNARQTSILTVLVGLQAALVNILSSHYTYHSYAQPILRVLLSQQWAHQLNLYLSGQHTDLVLATLKLLNAVSVFAGGRERKGLLDNFAWEAKNLPKLLHMRRKAKGNVNVDMLARPDIRTLYIMLVLSFIDSNTPSSIKSAFLEQHRDAFTSIFKGIWQDSYPVIRRVLEVCWSGLWSDAKLKRTLKVQTFNEATLIQLIRIYERSSPERPDSESIPADVVHHFLLALCSHPGVGVCFQDRGWYARETDNDPRGVKAEQRIYGDGPQRGSKIYNKILANVLKNLKVNEDPRQQELALKILAACPELVSVFWSSAGFALEPRLSSKWLANIAFFGTVVSLPVPTASFLLHQSGSGSTTLYQPTPPLLSIILENVMPTAHIKIHLSRGLQNASPLVQHSCALALAKCLSKYEQVVRAFRAVESALEEDEDDGLWARRRCELEREVRKRVPDFQVIVGFSQRMNEPASLSDGKDKQKEIAPNSTRAALLAESAHRLLWLYHSLLPSVVAEARFDTGKLLQAVEEMLSQSSVVSLTRGLDTLRQLHVLRLLKESDYFTWSSKSGSKHSNFYILLKAYIITRVPAVRTTIGALLRHILAPGVLFQHDEDEIALWLECLPLTRRAAGAKAPDGSALTDEGDGVISFLDNCVQRCLKTPYKYVEELQAMHTAHYRSTGEAHGFHTSTSSIGQRPDAFPSPLLATVVEQLGAKLRGKLLSPSDALALFSFARKLLLRIASKSADLVLPKCFAATIAAFVEGQELFPEFPTMEMAIAREGSLLVASIQHLENPCRATAQSTSPLVHNFLARIESSLEPDSESARQISAYEVVDWLRLSRPSLQSSELSRLIAAIEKYHKPALREFFQYLDPRHVPLWTDADPTTAFSRISHEISFNTLFLHCTSTALEETTWQRLLVDSLSALTRDVAAIRRAVCLLLHRLSSPAIADTVVRALLLVLAGIIHKIRGIGHTEVSSIVLLCFNSEIIKSLSARSSSSVIREGMHQLLEACHGVDGEGVMQRFACYAGHWILALRESMDNMDENQRATALLWFRYTSAEEVYGLLEYLADRAEHTSVATQEMIGRVLQATARTLSRELDAATQALSLLTRLQELIPQSAELTSLIASGTQGSLPLCHDGYLPERPISERTIESLLPDAAKRWSLRLQSSLSLSAASFLSDAPLSDSYVEILANLLYRERSSRSIVVNWLTSTASSNLSTTHLVRLLYAYYDSARSEEELHSAQADGLATHLSSVVRVVVETSHSRDTCSKAADCVVAMFLSSGSSRSKRLKLLIKKLTSVTPDKLSSHSLYIGRRLWETLGAEVAPLAEQLADLGLKWAVQHFVDDKSVTDQSRSVLTSLALMIASKVSVKSHLAEPVVAAVIQDQLANGDGVRFARLLASSTTLKPVTINKFLQTVLQHVKFYVLCAVTSGTSRDSIINLLHTLFHLHPNNTCQPSHIDPLRKVYGGSLGAADTKILAIFQLFEATRRTSVTSLLSQWSIIPDVPSVNALEAVQCLDPSRVLKTCLEYPEWRKLTMALEDCSPAHDHLYDPVFVLLLFAQTLVDNTTTSALAWVQLFRTNAVSLVIRMLSAKDARLREVAWAQLAALYRALETADVQEQSHVLHVLNLLKDLTPSAPSRDPPRLSAYITLLLAHAFRGIFYPSNFIYPLTARFLLQRPILDPTDVPMLYGMLYSASDDWKKERGWIVKFLSDGIVGSEEWKILKRRHTWDLLASLFQSEERDRTLRHGVLEVLANVTCNARATTSLILRHALLAWIKMQLETMRGEEAVAWVRILENILAVGNASKVEAATAGEWRAISARCLQTILRHPACTQSVFIISVPVILRLCLLPGHPTSDVPALLASGLHWLAEMETGVTIPSSNRLAPSLRSESDEKSCVILNHSQHLFDPPPSPSVELWGECVEALWRTAMTLTPQRTNEWDSLTNRLLIWRSIAGPKRSRVGEWVRQEVLDNLVSVF